LAYTIFGLDILHRTGPVEAPKRKQVWLNEHHLSNGVDGLDGCKTGF